MNDLLSGSAAAAAAAAAMSSANTPHRALTLADHSFWNFPFAAVSQGDLNCGPQLIRTVGGGNTPETFHVVPMMHANNTINHAYYGLAMPNNNIAATTSAASTTPGSSHFTAANMMMLNHIPQQQQQQNNNCYNNFDPSTMAQQQHSNNLAMYQRVAAVAQPGFVGLNQSAMMLGGGQQTDQHLLNHVATPTSGGFAISAAAAVAAAANNLTTSSSSMANGHVSNNNNSVILDNNNAHLLQQHHMQQHYSVVPQQRTAQHHQQHSAPSMASALTNAATPTAVFPQQQQHQMAAGHSHAPQHTLSSSTTRPASAFGGGVEISGLRKKHNCRMCGQAFDTRAALQSHNHMHMREAKPFKCTQCSKAFANSSYLSQHMRIHLGLRPYSCEQCSKRFTQLSHLQQHRRTHSGERPYKCPHLTCTKAFSQLSNLQSHSRCHQSNAVFKCNSCYKCFDDEQSLLEHIPRHRESKHLKKHICRYCGKAYAQETYLLKHLNKHPENSGGESAASTGKRRNGKRQNKASAATFNAERGKSPQTQSNMLLINPSLDTLSTKGEPTEFSHPQLHNSSASSAAAAAAASMTVENLVQHLWRSNGMAAGNSIPTAVVPETEDEVDDDEEETDEEDNEEENETEESATTSSNVSAATQSNGDSSSTNQTSNGQSQQHSSSSLMKNDIYLNEEVEKSIFDATHLNIADEAQSVQFPLTSANVHNERNLVNNAAIFWSSNQLEESSFVVHGEIIDQNQPVNRTAKKHIGQTGSKSDRDTGKNAGDQRLLGGELNAGDATTDNDSSEVKRDEQ